MRVVKVTAWDLTDQELDELAAECSATEPEYADELATAQGVAMGTSRFAAAGRSGSSLLGRTVSRSDTSRPEFRP